MYNLDSIEDVAYKAYKRLMGEREAESSRGRMGINSDERKRSMPNYDEGALLWNENVDKSKPVLHRTRQNSDEASKVQEVSAEEVGRSAKKESSDLQRDLEEEISIIDEALKDKSLPSADRVALRKTRGRFYCLNKS